MLLRISTTVLVWSLLVPFSAHAQPRPSPLLAPLSALAEKGVKVGAAFALDGKEIAALNPRDLLNPASATKVFTAATALDVLGADYRVRASVSVSPDRKTIYIAGHGDPMLTATHLATLAKCVRDAGVTAADRLTVVLAPFSADSTPPAFDQKRNELAYRAGVAGFQVNLNAIEVRVTPGKPGEKPAVAVEPRSGYIRVENTAITGGGKSPKKKGRLAISTARDPKGGIVVRVSGTGPKKGATIVYRRVPDPAMSAGLVFHRILDEAGVKVKSGPQISVTEPSDSTVLCTHDSPTLAEMLGPVLKDSQNQVAETLLRLSGAAGAKGPVGFSEGPAAMSSAMKNFGLEQSWFRFTNGSGLYDANKVSARALVKVLEHARRTPGLAPLAAGLPAAGQDGTMKNRLKKTPLAGKVRAKTGTLDDAVALAGFMDLPGGRTVTFAVIANMPPCKASPKDSDDDEECQKVPAGEAKAAIDATLLKVWEEKR